MKMSLNTKLEVALEVISSKIADVSRKGYTVNDKEMQILLEEKSKLYAGNEEVLDKIINVYGPEMRKRYKEGNE